MLIDLRDKGCCPHCQSCNQTLIVQDGFSMSLKCPACGSEVEVHAIVSVYSRARGSKGAYYLTGFEDVIAVDKLERPDTFQKGK